MYIIENIGLLTFNLNLQKKLYGNFFMTGRLNKKTIIVTGAGSGLGRASAIKLAEEDAQVFCVDVNPETVKETSDIITSRGGAASHYQADMCSETEIISMVTEAEKTYNEIDGLLANAGIAGTGAS